MKEFVQNTFKWYGQFSLLIQTSGINIFIDPYNLPDDINIRADYILFTHSHFDHLSFEDLEKISTKNTPMFAPSDVYSKLLDKDYKNISKVKPFEKIRIRNIDIETVPMYNIVKTQYHPKENNWVGYVFTIDEKRIYITGDTERIPEMKNINADIIFITLGQVYTMNSVDEAVEAVLDTGAKLAIPVHYGMYEGTKEDAENFCKKLEEKGVETMCLEFLGAKEK